METAGADSSKHKVVNAMKSVQIVQEQATDALRRQEDKCAIQQQQDHSKIAFSVYFFSLENKKDAHFQAIVKILPRLP